MQRFILLFHVEQMDSEDPGRKPLLLGGRWFGINALGSQSYNASRSIKLTRFRRDSPCEKHGHQSCLPPLFTYRVPTRRTRSRLWGTAIGSCHCHARSKDLAWVARALPIITPSLPPDSTRSDANISEASKLSTARITTRLEVWRYCSAR